MEELTFGNVNLAEYRSEEDPDWLPEEHMDDMEDIDDMDDMHLQVVDMADRD